MISPHCVLGFDPGSHGAVAVLTERGDMLRVLDIPTIEVKVGKTRRTRVAAAALASLIAEQRPAHAYVELVTPMPGQGTASMFAFGKAAGIIEGILAAQRISVTFITPQSWKRVIGVTKDKGACRRRAMELWPAAAASFLRVKDDGRAEAALIALAGLRQQPSQPAITP